MAESQLCRAKAERLTPRLGGHEKSARLAPGIRIAVEAKTEVRAGDRAKHGASAWLRDRAQPKHRRDACAPLCCRIIQNVSIPPLTAGAAE